MKKVVVITGAAGNVGQKLRAHLSLKGDYELRLLDIDPGGDPDIRPADLSTPDPAWTDLFEGADAVVHLAANGSAMAPWAALIGPNVDGVLNVYLAAAQQGVPRVVVASSVWAMAGRRFASGALAAGDADPGDNAYGATKLFAERIAQAFWRSHGVSSVALRLGACRPGTNPPLAHPDPWEAQCWVSNPDACRGFELAISAPLRGVAVVNLVSDNPGSRWTLDEAREALGYVPQDHGAAQPPQERPFGWLDRAKRLLPS